MATGHVLCAFAILVLHPTTALNQKELNEWIASLDSASLEYYRTHQPFRLRTNSQNIIISDQETQSLRAATHYAVFFSGSFTDNTVLQREPHTSALYGGCSVPNTAIALTMTDETTSKTTNFTLSTMANGDWTLLLPQTFPNGGNYTFNVSCPQCYNSTTKPHTFELLVLRAGAQR